MLFPSLLVLLAISTTVRSAPVAPEGAENQNAILAAAIQAVQAKADEYVKSLVEKVYGPLNEKVDKALLGKQIDTQVYQKKIIPELEKSAAQAQWQITREIYKQLFIQLGSSDASDVMPPTPRNYDTESFAITAGEIQRALSQPQSISSITAAYKKAIHIAKHHAIENAKQKLQGAIDANTGKFNEAKAQAVDTVADIRADWNSPNPSKDIQKVKDTYTKVKDVYTSAKDALAYYWGPKSE